MGMLQSCSPGLAVVNIDNGVGAGATAALIARGAAAMTAVPFVLRDHREQLWRRWAESLGDDVAADYQEIMSSPLGERVRARLHRRPHRLEPRRRSTRRRAQLRQACDRVAADAAHRMSLGLHRSRPGDGSAGAARSDRRRAPRRPGARGAAVVRRDARAGQGRGRRSSTGWSSRSSAPSPATASMREPAVRRRPAAAARPGCAPSGPPLGCSHAEAGTHLRRTLRRARDLPRFRPLRPLHARPGQVRRHPGRHHAGRSLGRAGGLRRRDHRGPRRRRVAGGAPRLRPDPPRPGACRRVVPCRSTSPSRSCTARSPRTAPSRACSRWPASPTPGPASLGSSVGMDKELMKAVFANAGLPQMDYLVLRDGAATGPDAVAAVEARLDYPVFVKPANLGSSVGMTKAHDRAELGQALELAAVYDRKTIVEATCDGRELECSLLGNDERARVDPRRGHPGQRVLRLRVQVHRGQDGLQDPRGRLGRSTCSRSRSSRWPPSRPSTRAASPAATSSSRRRRTG